MSEEKEMIQKLVNDLVDVALINNKIISVGSFKKDDIGDLELAIAMNNEVLKTFTNIEDTKEKKEEIEESE